MPRAGGGGLRLRWWCAIGWVVAGGWWVGLANCNIHRLAGRLKLDWPLGEREAHTNWKYVQGRACCFQRLSSGSLTALLTAL
jgi:hypothetical protein